MYARYYGLRRINPYRGVVQVADVGEATAHSYDGLTWHLRADDGHGLVRPTGVWEAGRGLKLGRIGDDLRFALETHPALPFPLCDACELWLLDQEEGRPLALLASARADAPLPPPGEIEWHPFAATFQGFHAPSLRGRGGGLDHRLLLAHNVNQAAGPHPRAQWFRREGAGEGAPAEAFPELLVREEGNSRLEQSVIADYHAFLAPLLLLWPRQSRATRARLEALACEHPQRLARVQRLLPERIDPARINAALVAARLEAAQGKTDDNWMTD